MLGQASISKKCVNFIDRCFINSGQIIATSHDRFPPNDGLVREIPGYFREIDRLVKYYSIWPDIEYYTTQLYGDLSTVLGPHTHVYMHCIMYRYAPSRPSLWLKARTLSYRSVSEEKLKRERCVALLTCKGLPLYRPYRLVYRYHTH